MFISSLRRQPPALLRITASSIRALTHIPSPNLVVLRSAPSKADALCSPAAQQRFFAVSAYLRNEANAAAQEMDSDPPAGEYNYAGHGEDHHVGRDEPVTKFQQLVDKGIVDKSIINIITKGMGYEEMTKVQQRTIMETVNGDNVLAQARTGTGKTIAFLLPVLQRILKAERPLVIPQRSRGTGSFADIRAIIVSPTRELATQIAVDARKLASGTKIIVQTAVGGSGKRAGLMDIHRLGCHILVATPGRLLDLLTDPSGVQAPNLEIFVMDEADNLLDVGFASELDNIIAALPPRDQPIGSSGKGRQSLLFSATVPDKVLSVAKKTMGKNYKVLRMVEKGEASTHERVEQKLVRCNSLENLVPTTYELILREISALNARAEAFPFKAIVFFSATRWASLAAETFRGLRGDSLAGPHGHPLHPTRIFEIHSRLTQSQRDNAAERFRRAESAILFSSDVTARGMDFPKVTHVIQVGGPRSHEQYIHRLGRTARGSAEGVGYIIIPEIEMAHVMRELRGLPLTKEDSLTTSRLDLSAEQSIPESTANIITAITEASMRVPIELKARTYSALIGVYTATSNKHDMIGALNRLATLGWGMETPPFVSPMIARKMGIDKVPGVNMSRGEDDFIPDSENSSRSGGYGNRGGGSSRGGRGGFRGGSRDGGFRPWEGRGRTGGRGDRPGRGGFGGPSRGGGGREYSGGRGGFGDRGGFSNDGGSGGRGDFGGRGGFSNDGGSGGRGGFGNRPSYGDRESSGGRGGFGESRGRGGFSRGGGDRSFGGGDRSFGGGYKGAGYGGRTSFQGYEGNKFGGPSKSDRNVSSYQDRNERGTYGQRAMKGNFEAPFNRSEGSESSFRSRSGSRSGSGMSRFDD